VDSIETAAELSLVDAVSLTSEVSRTSLHSHSKPKFIRRAEDIVLNLPLMLY